jgi:hypothetical protein
MIAPLETDLLRWSMSSNSRSVNLSDTEDSLLKINKRQNFQAQIKKSKLSTVAYGI